MDDLELVVVGGGIGGYTAAIRAAESGWRVAVVERDRLGGTCLHRGCIPSKSFLRSAEVYVTAKTAAEYGVMHDAPVFSWTAARDRTRTVVERLYQGLRFLMKRHRIAVISGTGRLLGPSIFSPQAGAVAVEGTDGERSILTPRFTLLATGSKPRPLSGMPFDHERVLSSDDLLTLDELPRSVLIVGAGATGVEWASVFSDLGTAVTLVEAQANILPEEDPDIAREMVRLLKKRGVRVLTNASVLTETLRVLPDGLEVDVTGPEDTTRVRAEYALVAVGRDACVDDLGLSAAGVRVGPHGIEVDEHYCTSQSNVYAVGDVVGRLQLAHVAAHEAVHAVQAMTGQPLRPFDYMMVPRPTYARPQVASVGLTEPAARLAGRNVKIGKVSFRALGKAWVEGEVDGFAKMVVDADSEDVLGVHIIGPRATDLVAEGGACTPVECGPVGSRGHGASSSDASRSFGRSGMGN
ncbi:dihydrolipoyl dehydrogenase [Alicyclobacillus herbarius]|uniref:dihydrolipoyl dehydrogenase n=1 Tax=Alicyclobacillus herbarius TaxID=122960 RepID=UPI000400FE66|nr:dihydrolipoyl dehydrogenase [Alicyclobacillus herbarius]